MNTVDLINELTQRIDKTVEEIEVLQLHTAHPGVLDGKIEGMLQIKEWLRVYEVREVLELPPDVEVTFTKKGKDIGTERRSDGYRKGKMKAAKKMDKV